MAESIAPTLQVLGVEAFEQPLRLRLPFQAGPLAATEAVQLVVRVHLRLDDGREGFGYAAELLAGRAAGGSPTVGDVQRQHQLRKSVELAIEAYVGAPPSTPFELFADNHRHQVRAGRELGLPALAASYGQAVLDRAVLDAVCRLLGASFWSAMRSNLAGLTAHPVIADLGPFDFSAFLAGLQPVRRIEARHSVATFDRITALDAGDAGDVPDAGDGLPATLDDVVDAFGQRCFKLELSGDLRADLDRLTRIAAVLDTIAGPLHVTLDGNERYTDVDAVVELWSRMEEAPALQRLCASTLYVAQPIRRELAPSRSVAALARLRPVVIDASDGELDAFVRARPLGYTGVASRSDRGFYRALVNLARCRVWNASGAEGAFFQTGEDLGAPAGLALQQDLALVALLGLADVERRGHLLVDGFAGRPPADSEAFAAAHADLYDRAGEGAPVRLSIRAGQLALGSLECAGFGSATVPDLSTTAPMLKADWPTGTAPVIVPGLP